MAQFTNADILTAVLVRFAQPLIQQAAQLNLFASPATQMAENKIRTWLGLSPNWGFATELAQFAEPGITKVIAPFIKNKLAALPDDAIPQMAHEVVDIGIKNGGMTFLEGRLHFDANDLAELKQLLNYNLPYTPPAMYEVKTDAAEQKQAAPTVE